MKKRWIIILILIWLGLHLANPVDLIRNDLGRHIKNGELILQGHWDVLYKNYYSYVNPEYPFVNEHWLFGVFCYVLWHYFAFTGLAFVYLILELIAFYVFFRCWQRYSSFTLACAVGLLSIPLIASRSDIRPEGITYLFCGLFWWMIDCFQQKRLKSQHLIIGLCLLQVIWVNMHFFFWMGPILTALFWWQARSNGENQQADVLQKLFLILLGMCLINPSGINGLLPPFRPDRSFFEYPNLENYPVLDLLKDKTLAWRSVLVYFLASFSMLIVPLFFLIRREGLKKHILVGSLTLLLSIAALKANRMIGLFGYFWIPLSMYVWGRWLQYAKTPQSRKNIEISLLIMGIIVSASVNFNWKQSHSLGIVPGSNNAAEFFKREKIGGPIFNDINIGSYLIFHLSPERKIFIDTRPEAYPFILLKKASIQWDDKSWHELDQRYHFNVIFMTPEHTDWGRRFLIRSFEDPAWAPVYLSNEAIIFLKRNAQNAQIIKRNEIREDKITITL